MNNPQEVSVDGRVDVLKVTFWDTSYFKSKEGVPCRCGTALTQGIFRQISLDSAKIVDDLDWIIGVAGVFTIFTAIAALDLLPTWMFINSLSLVAHTTMIKVNVPGNVNHLFMKYINLFKFNWWEVNDKAADRFSGL